MPDTRLWFTSRRSCIDGVLVSVWGAGGAPELTFSWGSDDLCPVSPAIVTYEVGTFQVDDALAKDDLVSMDLDSRPNVVVRT